MEYRGLTEKQIEDILDAVYALKEVSEFSENEAEIEVACEEFLAVIDAVA